MSKFKIGDKVRINKREGSVDDYPYSFCESMNKLAGTICKIQEIRPVKDFVNSKSKYINGDYHMYKIRPVNSSDHRDFVWSWHSSMFEPVLEDSEPQTSTSFKEGDLLPICGIIGRIRRIDSAHCGYYLCFDDITEEQEHLACCAKLRELVSNFDKIAAEYILIHHYSKYFPEFSTIDDLVKFVQAINDVYECKKSITTTKTLNENEIRFQKPKATFSRGSVPKGNPICGRRRKTAIVVGHLSNQEISC